MTITAFELSHSVLTVGFLKRKNRKKSNPPPQKKTQNNYKAKGLSFKNQTGKKSRVHVEILEISIAK